MHLISQSQYTKEQLATWSFLYDLMIGCDGKHGLLRGRACDEFFTCLKRWPMITRDAIPDLEQLDAVLRRESDWSIVRVPGAVSDRELAQYYSRRQTPMCVGMRPWDKRDHSPGPDIWHDVIGHLLLLLDKRYANCVYLIGVRGLEAIKYGYLPQWVRVFFHATEVALMNTRDGFRVAGPATLTSSAEVINALREKGVTRSPLDLRKIMRMPNDDSDIQREYFYFRSFRELESYVGRSWLPEYQAVQIVQNDARALA